MTTNNSQVQTSPASPAPAAAPATEFSSKNSVLIRMAAKYGCDTDKFYNTLKTTCFRVRVKNEKGQYVYRAPSEAEFMTFRLSALMAGVRLLHLIRSMPAYGSRFQKKSRPSKGLESQLRVTSVLS